MTAANIFSTVSIDFPTSPLSAKTRRKRKNTIRITRKETNKGNTSRSSDVCCHRSNSGIANAMQTVVSKVERARMK